MGHERVGRLPRSRRWINVIEGIGAAAGDSGETARLANATLQNVRDRLDRIETDRGVAAAFQYLLALARSPAESPGLPDLPDLSANPSAARLALGMCRWVDENRGALEYAEIAKQAAADTIAHWSHVRDPQQDIFSSDLGVAQRWRQASTGAGFSEVAREFFARFTERYLRYFLDREASAALRTVEERERFATNLGAHVDSVARHAFETSKITQSFAAGWYNRYAREGAPSAARRRAFLRLAFHKIREELAREASTE